MPKATKESNRSARAAVGAPGKTDKGEAASGSRPSDSEVSFEHLLRDMVIARDEARKKRD